MKSRSSLGTHVAAAALVALVAMTVLGENRAMADPDKTVTITVREKKNELKLCKGDVLEIKLEMQAGTGFSWQVAENAKDVLPLKGKPTIEKMDNGKPGGTQLQVFRFEAKAPGASDLELHYKRPFEKDKPPAKTFKLTIRVVDAK